MQQLLIAVTPGKEVVIELEDSVVLVDADIQETFSHWIRTLQGGAFERLVRGRCRSRVPVPAVGRRGHFGLGTIVASPQVAEKRSPRNMRSPGMGTRASRVLSAHPDSLLSSNGELTWALSC